MCIHVKKPNAIKNPAIQKINKNHDKKVDIHVNMMQKFSWNLELKCTSYEFCKLSNEFGTNEQDEHVLLGQHGWPVALL